MTESTVMSAFALGFGLGLFVAAQIGPVSLLIVRSVLRGSLRIGLAMVAAVALVDLLYAALGLAGAARLFDAADGARLALGLVGATVLVVLGARTVWSA
jgi:threonine/homoserine/homoserine lactone efflux protein